MSTIKIDTTKRGYAAMWEQGGGMTSGGSATIITGRSGEARRPIYMPRGGHLACGKHALIGVANGFIIVTASVRRGERESASIKRIVGTTVKDVHGEKFEATAEVEVLNTFTRGEWDKPLDSKFEAAVEAAFRKAGSYHCRSAYYVDNSARPERSDADKKRMEAEMRRQDEERARLRQAKADADAKAKADAEAASKAAKDAGLGARLEAVNERLVAIGLAIYELGEVEFTRLYSRELYTEASVRRAEQGVAQAEADHAERERKRRARATFQPRFEVHVARAKALDLTVEFNDESVRLGGEWQGYSYSEDGLVSFTTKLAQKEQEKLEARLKAEAEARYEELKAEAEAAGLPQNIEIWKRRGGATNAGDGWVVMANGMCREPDEMNCPRPRYRDEGTQVWRQILPGELVLRWAKAYTAAEHEFEVVYCPESITPEQMRTVALFEEELAEAYDGRRGMSSGNSSPSIGDGWGLAPKPEPKPAQPASMVDLVAKFNSR